MKKVCVIGAGIGGMSAAMLLSSRGYHVEVFERSTTYGGKAGESRYGGYRFDMGPTLLTLPLVLRGLFEACGENIDAYLRLIKLESSCRYFYSDGSVIDAYADNADFAIEIEKKTGIKTSVTMKFLRYCERIYEYTADIFLYTRFQELRELVKKLRIRHIIGLFRIDPFRSMHTSHTRYFNDDRVVRMLDRFATYNGSDPYRSPATLNIISHVDLTMGAFVPEGGIRSIAHALHAACVRKGVIFHFETPVTKILSEGKRVQGIQARESFVTADAVICNADVRTAYASLIGDVRSFYAKRYRNAEDSSSVIVFHLGIRGTHEKLNVHNVVFGDHYRREFTEIFEKKKIPSDPTIYIYISSKYSPDDAPEGCENWFVLVYAPPSPHRNDEADLTQLQERIFSRIKEVCSIDVAALAEYIRVITPNDIERITGSYHGSLYGPSSNSRMNAFFRQANKSRYLKNLYFCGGSAHPGGGIPLASLSGRHAAEALIAADRG